MEMTDTNIASGAAARFTKKPVTITASQWFKPGDHPMVEQYDPEKAGAYIKGPGPYGWIKTLEGGHIVSPGDWIITGVAGEHYPCKPDIFAATYSRAALASAPAQPVAEPAQVSAVESNTAGAVPAHHTDNAPLGYTIHEKSAWSVGYEEGYRASRGQAPAAGAVAGPGWQMVPVEPTEAMFTRFSQQIETGVVYVGGFLQAYRCMLDAAPTLAAPAPSVLEDAARYRWLREGNDAKHGAAWHVAVNLYGCEWDAAIDAAIATQGEKT